MIKPVSRVSKKRSLVTSAQSTGQASLSVLAALIVGVCLVAAFTTFGYQLGHTAVTVKDYERTVRVKGLSEREFPADTVIWPIKFTVANNSLEKLYQTVEAHSSRIRQFLIDRGIAEADISYSIPSITDKLAQQWNNGPRAEFRFAAVQHVTVHSKAIEVVRAAMNDVSELGKQGLVISGDSYEAQTTYLFSRLNEVKPEMVEEATRNAREVAEKFANDSQSALGKIKRASQGQFSIASRDQNNPHIKKVRVVSTIEYYLSD